MTRPWALLCHVKSTMVCVRAEEEQWQSGDECTTTQIINGNGRIFLNQDSVKQEVDGDMYRIRTVY